MRIAILCRDEHFVAVHKPSGLLVHPTRMAQARGSCLQFLRDQLGQWVYPIHRLDRAASGVLLFGLNPEAAAAFSELFRARQITKTYYAVVRGWVEDAGTCDKPLKKDAKSPANAAVTHYEPVARVELPVTVGRYATARYSLVRVQPETGRFHQIRKHFSSMSHHLIGDTVYGDGKHNRLFRERYGIHRLLLAARAVEFRHPFSGLPWRVEADWPAEYRKLFSEFGWYSY